MKQLSVVFLLLFLVGGCNSESGKNVQKNVEVAASRDYVVSKDIPQFKVTGFVPSGLVLLVPADTSNDKLKLLINEFRKARENNFLSTLIPPTTKGSATGDYNIVWIFVFSEERWATRDNVLSYINSKTVDRDIVNNIRAEYYYTTGSEYGNLGCRDEKNISPNYEYLF